MENLIKIYQICPFDGHRFKCFNVQQKLEVGMCVHQRLRSVSCADPESFVRGGGSNFAVFGLFFKLDERRNDPNTKLSGPLSARQQNAI